MKQTVKRKNGMKDLRFACNRNFESRELSFWQKYGPYICVALLGALAGTVLVTSLMSPSRKIVSPTGVSKVKQVQAVEPPFCFDAISCIRDVGTSLGEPNDHIKTMVRIARAESNFRPYAKNSQSTASGVFQILWGTWNANNCQGSAFNFKDNVICAWRLHIARGFQPWNASKKVWSN